MRRPYFFSQQNREHFLGLFFSQRIKAKLGVESLVAPCMLVLRPVINQQQEMRRGYTLAQESKKGLGFGVQPVQVLEDQDKELVQTLAQQQSLDGFKCTLAPNLPIHLL